MVSHLAFLTPLPLPLPLSIPSVSHLRPSISTAPPTTAPTTLPHAHNLRKQSPRAVADPSVNDHPLSFRFVDAENREPCILVGVEVTTHNIRRAPNRLFDLMSSLHELSQLADTAGLSVVSTLTQTLPAPDPSTYIRSGKVSELRTELQAHRACTAVFDVELSPAQQRALEETLSGKGLDNVIKVLDRTALIIDIFGQHAATREGQLQVELALYQYRLPRLTKLWTHLERQSGQGGVGLRGPGETQLEVDRRLINARITHLKRQLALVRAHRSRLRASRRRNLGLPVVALIGYTNAGKSTLLNRMTGAHALEADALFATLDPTLRRARLEGLHMSPEVLVTDTVGFVQNLPTELVAAFRATLEEVVEADLLLHVVDVAGEDEIVRWQMSAVESVLEDIGAGGKPTVIVVNKIDAVSEDRVQEVVQVVRHGRDAEVVAVSARSGVGVDEIGVAIEDEFRRGLLRAEVLIPYGRGDLTAMVYERGCVLAEEHVNEGTKMVVRVPGDLWTRLREFMVVSEEEEVDVFAGGVEAEVDEDRDAWVDLAKGRH